MRCRGRAVHRQNRAPTGRWAGWRNRTLVDPAAEEEGSGAAFITCTARSGPPVRLTGSLSTGSGAAVVSPGSRMRSLSLFAAVLDASGHVVPAGSGDVVTAEIRHEAPFLDGGVLTRAFGLPGGGLSTVDHPPPPGAADTTLRAAVEFPGNHLGAEWWHRQDHDVLVPGVSQFGAEILALDSVGEADLQARAGLWASRRRIFQRGRDGWW